jgi:CheY-like chemotaxis protein
VSEHSSPRSIILVVEDNPANQLLIQFTLESGGYRVEVAGSAREALASIERRRPELILMDIQLPGQDGLSLTRQLKADPGYQAIPVVALTAHAMAGDRELSLAAGCSGYITKPIDTRTILDQVGHYLTSDKPTSESS